MIKPRTILIFLLCICLLLIASCAAGPNDYANIPTDDGKLAGFWLGLWHGVIFPFTFIISLFTDNVHFYEVHNNGNWYNFGFFLGALIALGGSGSGASRTRKVVVEHR